MDKIKKFFSDCYRGYCKVKEIIFYLLLAVAVACGFFIYKENKEYDRKTAEVDARAADYPKVSVTEENMENTLLYNHLERAGLEKLEIYGIVNKLDSVMQTRKLRKQDSFILVLSDEGKFKMLAVTRDLSRYYVANVEGELVAGIMDIEIKTRTKTACGEIKNSLYASMSGKGMDVPLIIAFTDVFSWNIDFNTETRNGDAYCVVWEEDYTANGMIVEQTVLAAKYKGEAAGVNYAFNYDGDFFDADGKVSKRMFLKSPISFKGVRITSRFTASRMHPILRIRRPHYGIDYAAPVGTPIEAVADGVVKFVGVEGGFGNYIEITHANNFVSCYGHLKSFNVKLGEKVRQGKVIAYLGSSGLSTGPHLDFRIREKGKYIDFLSMKNRNSSVGEIPADKLEEFKAQRDKYMRILEEAK